MEKLYLWVFVHTANYEYSNKINWIFNTPCNTTTCNQVEFAILKRWFNEISPHLQTTRTCLTMSACKQRHIVYHYLSNAVLYYGTSIDLPLWLQLLSINYNNATSVTPTSTHTLTTVYMTTPWTSIATLATASVWNIDDAADLDHYSLHTNIMIPHLHGIHRSDVHHWID